MENEHALSPERKEVLPLPTGIFNLEKLSHEHLIALIESLYEAMSPEDDANDEPKPGDRKAGEVGWILEQDLKALAEADPDKAYELFEALSTQGRSWSKQVAMDTLGDPLAKHFTDVGDLEKRSAIVDRWVSFLDDENRHVRDSVHGHLFGLVDIAEERPDWLDEPTAVHIASELEFRQDGYRSHGRDAGVGPERN